MDGPQVNLKVVTLPRVLNTEPILIIFIAKDVQEFDQLKTSIFIACSRNLFTCPLYLTLPPFVYRVTWCWAFMSRRFMMSKKE